MSDTTIVKMETVVMENERRETTLAIKGPPDSTAGAAATLASSYSSSQSYGREELGDNGDCIFISLVQSRFLRDKAF